jgi:hypothetical protein
MSAVAKCNEPMRTQNGNTYKCTKPLGHRGQHVDSRHPIRRWTNPYRSQA